MPQLPQQPPPSSCLWNLARSGAHFSSCLLAPPLAQPRPKDPDCWGSRDQKNFCMEHRRAREEPKRILGQALTQWASEGLGQGGCMETQETKAGYSNCSTSNAVSCRPEGALPSFLLFFLLSFLPPFLLSLLPSFLQNFFKRLINSRITNRDESNKCTNVPIWWRS